MKLLFSKRCQKALNDKKIVVSLSIPVRNRILKLLQNFNATYYESDETGFNYQTTTVDELPELIKSKLGIDLICYGKKENEKITGCTIEDFVLRGVYPPNLFDTLEVLYSQLDEKNKPQFQTKLNEIFEENDSCFRMADGQIFPVNSVYINEAITQKTYELLSSVKFSGALEEFNKARTFLSNGDNEEAINNANLAVESTIKEILNIEKAKPGELFRKLIDSGLIPEYYKGFLKAFEENILRCVAIIRNEELGVGHGKGSSKGKIVPELAELAVNLSAVVINFLVKKTIGCTNIFDEETNDTEFANDDIPF